MKNKIVLLTATLAVAGLAQVASATPSPAGAGAGLWLWDTASSAGSVVWVGVNGAGNATYSGNVGDFSIGVLASGVTGGTTTGPEIDLDITQVTKHTGAGVLEVFFSNGAFGPTTGGFTLSTGVNSGSGSVSTSALLGSAAFGSDLGVLVNSVNDTIGAYTVNNGSLSASSYFLTIEDVITGDVTSADTSLTTVPDGGATMMLLGMGLSGVALLRKKLTA